MEDFDRKRKRSEELSHVSTFQMPLGFMFEPTEQELIAHYLLKEVTGMPLPLDGFVHTFNVYGSSEPWEIWQMFGGLEKQKGENMDLFFFTKLKRVSTGKDRSKNFVRKVGSGTWFHESTSAVFDYNGESQIGSKKRFRYENKKMREQQGLWNMMEFSLEDSYLLKCFQKLPTDVVLCRIRYNYEKGRKRRSVETGKEEMVVGDDGGVRQNDIVEVRHMKGGDVKVSTLQENLFMTETLYINHAHDGVVRDEMLNGEGMLAFLPPKQDQLDAEGKEAGIEEGDQLLTVAQKSWIQSFAQDLSDWDASEIAEHELLSLQQSNCYQSFAQLLSS